jgi:hypothetical protein
MGALPVIGTAVSVIGGISQASAQSKQQAAQQAQIDAQAQAQAANTEANKQLLAIQKEQNRKQYDTSVLSQMAAYSQQSAGIQASLLQAQAKNSSDVYGMKAGNLQKQGQLDSASYSANTQQNLTDIQASQQSQQSSARQLGASNALSDADLQAIANMTDAERKALAYSAAHNGDSTISDQEAMNARLRDAIAASLESAHGVDRAQSLSAMQGLNEQELIALNRQIGVSTNAASQQTIGANRQLAQIGSDLGQLVSNSNYDLTKKAGGIAQQQLDYANSLTSNSAYDAYQATQDSLTQQQTLNEKTGSISQAGYQSASSNAGGGFLDYLSSGAKMFGSVYQLLNQTPTQNTSSYSLASGGQMPSSSFYVPPSFSSSNYTPQSVNTGFTYGT